MPSLVLVAVLLLSPLLLTRAALATTAAAPSAVVETTLAQAAHVVNAATVATASSPMLPPLLYDGTATCVECEGQIDWSGVYNTTANQLFQCDPLVCCCPVGLAVVYQVGSLVLVSSAVNGTCSGLEVVFFGVVSTNEPSITISVLSNDISIIRADNGDVRLTDVEKPVCTGVAVRIADVDATDPYIVAETVPTFIVWLALGMAAAALAGILVVGIYHAVAGLSTRGNRRAVGTAAAGMINGGNDDAENQRPLLSTA